MMDEEGRREWGRDIDTDTDAAVMKKMGTSR